MSVRRTGMLWTTALLTLLTSAAVYGQTRGTVTPAQPGLVQVAAGQNPASTLTASKFEAWCQAELLADMNDQKDKPNKSKTKVRAVESAVRWRFDNDRSVTDQSIKTLTEHWRYIERPVADGAVGGTPTQVKLPGETDRFIVYALTKVNGRSDLLAWLHDYRASALMSYDSNNQLQVEEWEKSWAILSELNLDNGRRRVSNLLNRAASASLAGNTGRADALYTDAAQYPWYMLEPEAQEEFKQLYIKAMYGLIHVRRNNLEALKAIYIPPSMTRRIQPALDQAILDAGKKGEAK